MAPAQFEIAAMFEELNLAVDHNMLVMEVLRQTAERHGLVCLMHEKPFAGVNGSGKHNNWSVSYGRQNLLDPGADPAQNAIFLTVLTSIIRAINLHSDILRTSTAYAGNDHRLGANEAPPAIVSIFLGEQLTEAIEALESGESKSSTQSLKMRVGVDALPSIPRDTTDRNRTSPFAFTGNKFEFRAPGSSQSCSGVNVVLNTIVAESFDYLAEKIEQFSAENFNVELQKLLQVEISANKRIIFNGDNYSSDWVSEAARRGLPNLSNTFDAIQPLLDNKNIKLFADYGVFCKEELHSRYEVYLEEYSRKIKIEAEIALEIANSMVMPVAVECYNRAVTTLTQASENGVMAGQTGIAKKAEKMGVLLDSLVDATESLSASLDATQAEVIAGTLKLREVVDAIEKVCDDRAWPLPKYREMLFVY